MAKERRLRREPMIPCTSTAVGGGAAPAPEEEPEAGAVRPHSGTEGQHGDGDSGYSSEESVDLYERHSVTAMGQRHDPV